VVEGFSHLRLGYEEMTWTARGRVYRQQAFRRTPPDKAGFQLDFWRWREELFECPRAFPPTLLRMTES